MLYYLHIPKSAGTSVRRLFSTIYGDRLIEVYQPISQSVTSNLMKRCDGNSVLFGHFCFSLHRLLHDPCPQYVTLVRHPLDRVASWFKHQLRDPQSRFFEPLHRKDLTIKNIVDRGLAPEVNNHSVRMICASYSWPLLYRTRDLIARYCARKAYYQFNARRHYEQAMRHVREYFSFIARIEEQDRLAKFLAAQNAVSASSLNIAFENVSPPELEIEIDPSTRDAILRANRLDLKLYEQLT